MRDMYGREAVLNATVLVACEDNEEPVLRQGVIIAFDEVDLQGVQYSCEAVIRLWNSDKTIVRNDLEFYMLPTHERERK